MSRARLVNFTDALAGARRPRRRFRAMSAADRPRGSITTRARGAAYGAEQKHVGLPTNVRSPLRNGHSCHDHPTGSFARGRVKTRHTTFTTGMRFSVLTAE